MSARTHFEDRQAEQEVLDADSFYDHERVAINEVLQALQAKIGRSMEGAALQREVRERFAEIGFVVRCDLMKDQNDPRGWDDKPWIPQITFVGRCEPMKIGEFDHDRQGHEVRSNILGVKGQDNVQKTQIAPGFARTDSGLVIPG